MSATLVDKKLASSPVRRRVKPEVFLTPTKLDIKISESPIAILKFSEELPFAPSTSNNNNLTDKPSRRSKSADVPRTKKVTDDDDVQSTKSAESPRKLFQSNIKIDPKVAVAYKCVQKATGALGGNGDTGAIYGEVTMYSMQRVLDVMKAKCELTHRSRIIDIGAGLGKPNFHASQDPACRLSIGVELLDIRWKVGVALNILGHN